MSTSDDVPADLDAELREFFEQWPLATTQEPVQMLPSRLFVPREPIPPASVRCPDCQYLITAVGHRVSCGGGS
jgi:hypothetical protein